jgi:hypothetical protein
MYKYPKNGKADSNLFTKYVIIVPSERDKIDLMSACKKIHDSTDLDNDYIPINQVMHEYQEPNNIIVNKDAYDILITLKTNDD